MKLYHIAAVSENGVIGKHGGIPWKISSDLERFKEITIGHPIIMGRGTYVSLGVSPQTVRRDICGIQAGYHEGFQKIHKAKKGLENRRDKVSKVVKVLSDDANKMSIPVDQREMVCDILNSVVSEWNDNLTDLRERERKFLVEEELFVE